MKLKELAIDGLGTRRDLHLGRFSEGLTLVYGENGAGKTTVRQFIRGTLFDIDQDMRLKTNAPYSAGRLNVICGPDEFQLSRDVQLNSEVDIRELTNTANSSTDRVNSLQQLAGSLNAELYDSVFSVSLRETPTNVFRLAHVLQNQLGVPSGSEAAGDESAYLNWQRETKLCQQQVESLRTQIDVLTVERNGFQNQIESSKSGRLAQINDIERQISQVLARLSEIQASPFQDQLHAVEREIAKLRSLINDAQNQVSYVAPEVPEIGQHSTLFSRLDEIDDQIRRWRHVQTDIQNQRVRLRDEMLVWNELTLDSNEHPYHNARAILVALESKVDEAERNANHWGDAAASRVDTSQMARTLGQLCQSMRDDLYGLCNELAQQYKHIRHKAAASELKQLRRCYSEMGENIQRLIQRRDSVIQEIREVDPAGADAIVRSNRKFCECAQHAGYLEARRRFVGQIAAPVGKPVCRVDAPNVQSEQGRLAILEQQSRELNGTLNGYEQEVNDLNALHADLLRQRDGLLKESCSPELSLKLQGIEGELQLLHSEYNAVLRQLEQNRDYVPIQPNALIHSACNLLTRITAGDLTQVFLNEPLASVDGTIQIGLLVRDRFGKVLNFSAIDPGLQDQVYLCLMLAAKQQLQHQNVQTPTLIDDAFCRITSERITPTLNELQDFAAQGHQIVALTQHRYLADRVPGVPLLELPPTMPSIQPIANPDRRSGTDPVIAPIPDPDWNPDSYLTTEAYATGLARRPSLLARPYPLSKYPYSNANTTTPDPGYAVSYPISGGIQQTTADDIGPSPAESSRSVSQTVTSIPVNSVGDRLDYVSSIDEATRLDKVGFFDPNQLRIFRDHGIDSVADLLELELAQGNTLGLHPDQIDRWQSQLWLLINLPGIRLNDARVLVACGVTDPKQLDTSHPQQILERIERFYSTSEGRRFAVDHDSISLERINGWYRSLDATRAGWASRHGSSPHAKTTGGRDLDYAQLGTRSESNLTGRRPYERTTRAYQPPNLADQGRAPRPDRETRSPRDSRPVREPRLARPPRMNTPGPERKVVPRVAPLTKMSPEKTTAKRSAKPSVVADKKLKFYLDLNDHVEAAPSIGPKTAERFEKIGINTVTDFLKQTAESMETKIKYKRITADLMRAWQHQARLVCRVPNLRGHDAQLLVACGITEPEELSTMQPKNLFDIIGPFSETKEGLKIIRNGKKPDLAEITDWISWAEKTRSLQAA